MYRMMHEQGEVFLGIPAADTFPGKSLLPQVGRIKRLIDASEARTILDYGSGKGRQYEPKPVRDGSGQEWPGIMDFWGVDEIVCYDPSYAPFSALPEGTFDGVISTDVLEHCPEEDVPWIVEEMFGFAERFLFANVACYPATKRLPNGENAHCTIKPVEWWKDIIEAAARSKPQVIWEVWLQAREATPKGQMLMDHKIGNS
jgi:hypothetical protein